MNTNIPSNLVSCLDAISLLLFAFIRVHSWLKFFFLNSIFSLFQKTGGHYLPNSPKNDDDAVATFCRSRPVNVPQRAATRPQSGELTQSSKIE
jgi:hypothetical protein